jgi:hypothetical protein
LRREEPHMSQRSFAATRAARGIVVGTAAVAALLLPASPTNAHEVREVGALTFVVGWASEPAYAGFGNEVQVIVTETRGERPVKGGQLQAVVIFGDPEGETRTEPLTLDPAFDAPNEYLGYIIPTRPGTYTFHVTGTVGGQTIDEVFTSGPETFNDVNNPADAEFPEQDPSRGELAEAVERLSARTEEEGGDALPLWIAVGAAAAAVVALVLSLRRRPAA